MKNFVRLNKNEMKMVMGGVEDQIEGGDTTCNCNKASDCSDALKPLCYNCGSNGEGDKKWGFCDK